MRSQDLGSTTEVRLARTVRQDVSSPGWTSPSIGVDVLERRREDLALQASEEVPGAIECYAEAVRSVDLTSTTAAHMAPSPNIQLPWCHAHFCGDKADTSKWEGLLLRGVVVDC